jgi:sterile alpha motif and leucine zipper-containing kinase AZK
MRFAFFFKKSQVLTKFSKLRHPNVLLFMGACTDTGHLMIVTELMPRGSVYDLLHDDKRALFCFLFASTQLFSDLVIPSKNENCKRFCNGNELVCYNLYSDYYSQVCRLHCSKPVFIHRDLKTGNLLVDKNWNVKVSDFGLSHIKSHNEGWKGSYGSIGTPLWMAPEVLLNKEYNESADLYSFGIVLWVRKQNYQIIHYFISKPYRNY